MHMAHINLYFFVWKYDGFRSHNLTRMRLIKQINTVISLLILADVMTFILFLFAYRLLPFLLPLLLFFFSFCALFLRGWVSSSALRLWSKVFHNEPTAPQYHFERWSGLKSKTADSAASAVIPHLLFYPRYHYGCYPQNYKWQNWK